MPFVWVEPKLFTQWRGVNVYHVYKNDNQDMILDHTYSLDTYAEEGMIDARELSLPAGVSTDDPNWHALAIQSALDNDLIEMPDDIRFSDAKPVVTATLKTDDGSRKVEFDAKQWLALASLDELEALIDCDYRGDLGADALAYWMEARDYRVCELLAYVRTADLPEDFSGFEVEVDPIEAQNWLSDNRHDDYWAVMVKLGKAVTVKGVVTEEIEVTKTVLLNFMVNKDGGITEDLDKAVKRKAYEKAVQHTFDVHGWSIKSGSKPVVKSELQTRQYL